MKIVGTNSEFVLVDLSAEDSRNELSLTFSNITFFPREFRPSEYKKFKLTIYGVEDLESAKQAISKFLNDYIAIEQTGNGNLIFWSDQYKIGEFEFVNYIEDVFDSEKEEWTENYRHLLREYYKESDLDTRQSILHNKFLRRLENVIDEERIKAVQKFKFFKEDKTKTNGLKEKLSFINRIENIKDQYLTEYRNLV